MNNNHHWPGGWAWILTLGSMACLLLVNASTFTRTELTYARIARIVIDVAIDTTGRGGVYTSLSNAIDSNTVKNYTGHITSIQIEPLGSVGTLPDSGWNIYVYDQDSNDVLKARGVDMDSNETIYITHNSSDNDSLQMFHALSQSYIRIHADSLRHSNGFRAIIQVEP